MSESEHRMIEILRILNVQEKPIGSKVIADELKTNTILVREQCVTICKFLMKKDTQKEKGILVE